VTNPNGPDLIDCREFSAAIASQLDQDLELARVTDLPVLISGSPDASRAIACELDRQSRSPKGAVEVVDCREVGAVRTLRCLVRPEDGRADAGVRARILLLQEVQALDPADQAELEREIEEIQSRRTRPIRLLASSSAPLFDRVVDQLFSERLFYRLNLIHVVVPPNHRFAGEPGAVR
jgi:transcriptional regulator of acetoin/glycerol metabolism